MSITLRATVYLIILFQKYRPKAPKILFTSKNPKPKIQSQLYHVTMRQNCLKKITRRIKRKGSEIKSENIFKSRKNRFRPPASRPLIFQREKKRGVTLVRSYILIVIRKATLPVTAPGQKTSVNLDYFYADD